MPYCIAALHRCTHIFGLAEPFSAKGGPGCSFKHCSSAQSPARLENVCMRDVAPGMRLPNLDLWHLGKMHNHHMPVACTLPGRGLVVEGLVEVGCRLLEVADGCWRLPGGCVEIAGGGWRFWFDLHVASMICNTGGRRRPHCTQIDVTSFIRLAEK